MKMLSAKFGVNRGDRNIAYDRWTNCNGTTKIRGTNAGSKRCRDRHKLTREERLRELILQHGGKNVSSAVRFIIEELKKQKHSLVNNESNKGSQQESFNDLCSCSCSCHISHSIKKEITTDTNTTINK